MKLKFPLQICLLVFVAVLMQACGSQSNTCEVCGYVAMNGDKCQFCGNSVWTDASGESKEEYVKTRQQEWFFTPGMETNLYEPEVTDELTGETFLKDSTWKPLITEGAL